MDELLSNFYTPFKSFENRWDPGNYLHLILIIFKFKILSFYLDLEVIILGMVHLGFLRSTSQLPYFSTKF